MELGFLAVLIFLYKLLAFIVMLVVAGAVTFGPIVWAAWIEHPLPLLIYIITPLVLTIIYKLLWLF